MSSTTKLSRRHFLISGASVLGASFLPIELLRHSLKEIEWTPLNPTTAAKYLKLYGNIDADSGLEPSLSVLLAMLCYSGSATGILSDPRISNSLNGWKRRFFTLPRVHRILHAVTQGEAGEDVVAILQDNLNKTGSNPVFFIPYWIKLAGWLKWRILNCVDPVAWRNFKKEYGLHDNAFICSQIDLPKLLKLPLRDLYTEHQEENK